MKWISHSVARCLALVTLKLPERKTKFQNNSPQWLLKLSARISNLVFANMETFAEEDISMRNVKAQDMMESNATKDILNSVNTLESTEDANLASTVLSTTLSR